jgi:hypothetical protein
VLETRHQIRRELEDRGYGVLPTQPLPRVGPQAEQTIREQLEQSALSIHLLGAYYGLIPEAAQQSLVEMQHRLALRHSQSQPRFPRLLWLPPALSAAQPELKPEPRQAQLIDHLRTDPASQQQADLLETSLEELKSVILETLDELAQPLPTNGSLTPDPAFEAGLTRIYLLYDLADQEEVIALDDYLYDYSPDFEIMTPLLDGDAALVRTDHQENLRHCDAVLIYCNQAGPEWLRARINDLRKAPGYGRPAPFRASAIYLAGAEDPFKRRYRTREVDAVIKHFAPFSAETLAPFLAKLQGGRG